MKIEIDPELILNATPNYTYGWRLGLTSEEVEASANATLEALIAAYESADSDEN